MYMHSPYAGYTCDQHDNPADFLLDVLTSCEKSDPREEVKLDVGEFFAQTHTHATHARTHACTHARMHTHPSISTHVHAQLA